MPGIETQKLTAHIGARVTGVDISAPLDEDTAAAVREALNVLKALVFDDGTLDAETQRPSARPRGGPPPPPPTVPPVDGAPTVLPVDSGGARPPTRCHPAAPFALTPPQASTL